MADVSVVVQTPLFPPTPAPRRRRQLGGQPEVADSVFARLTERESSSSVLVEVIHSRWRLRGAWLLVAIFTLFRVETLVLTSCPMHAGSASAHQSTSHEGHGEDSSSGSATGCDCLGSCVSTQGVQLARVEARIDVQLRVVPSPEFPSEQLVAPSVDQLLLPEAQGPPALLA